MRGEEGVMRGVPLRHPGLARFQGREEMNSKRILHGMIGGLAGGLAFGVTMGMLGMLPLAGHLVYGGILGVVYSLFQVSGSEGEQPAPVARGR